MPVDLAALGVEKLSVRERLELIDQIWETLPESVQADEVPEWHLVELARRRADAEARPGEGRPWRDVLDSLGSGS